MSDVPMIIEARFSPNERALIQEAVRRVGRAGRSVVPGPTDQVLAAVVRELELGRRDMFSLVKAGRRISAP